MKHEPGEWVIGAILNNGENFERAKRFQLSAEDFQNPSHKKIFAAMEKLNGDGISVDLTTIYSLLKEEDIGLARYLMNDIPTDSTFEYWAKMVKKQSLEMRLKELVDREEIDTGKVEVIAYELNNLGKDNPLYRPIKQVASEDSTPLIKTGFRDLDPNLKFTASRLVVVSGRTGEGKTSFGLQGLYYISKSRPVGVVSVEMTAQEIKERIINSFGTPPDNFFIADPPALSTLDLKHICKTMKAESGVEVVMVDYLQLMREREDFRSRHLEVSHIIRRIKEFAKELKMGFIVISTLSRGADHRAEPSLSDLKESGDVEYAADAVLFIHKPEKEDEKDKGKNVKLFIIAKNRWGKTADLKVFWDGPRTRFRNYGDGAIDESEPQKNLYEVGHDGQLSY